MAVPRHTDIRCWDGSVQARQGINFKDCTKLMSPSPLYDTYFFRLCFEITAWGTILCQHKDLGMGLLV